MVVLEGLRSRDDYCIVRWFADSLLIAVSGSMTGVFCIEDGMRIDARFVIG